MVGGLVASVAACAALERGDMRAATGPRVRLWQSCYVDSLELPGAPVVGELVPC